jgi:hypothetical protein
VLNFSTKIFSTILIVLFVSACERDIGTMIKEEKVQYHGITILSRLYPISGYGAERSVVYWCQSAKTLSFKSEYDDPLKDNGWLPLSALGAGHVNQKNKVLKRLPNERIHIIDNQFTYINFGSSTFVVTFDGCATVVKMPPFKFYDEYSDNKDQLFKRGELSLVHEYDFEGLTPQFVVSHTHQIVKGTSQYCFNINKEWIADKNNQYQVCTEDKGKSWFATRKIGEGKVMKRLAGSEEWIDFAI